MVPDNNVACMYMYACAYACIYVCMHSVTDVICMHVYMYMCEYNMLYLCSYNKFQSMMTRLTAKIRFKMITMIVW